MQQSSITGNPVWQQSNDVSTCCLWMWWLSEKHQPDFTDRLHAEFVIPERAYVGACRCLIVTVPNLNVLPSTHNMFTFCFVDALHFKLFFHRVYSLVHRCKQQLNLSHRVSSVYCVESFFWVMSAISSLSCTDAVAIFIAAHLCQALQLHHKSLGNNMCCNHRDTSVRDCIRFGFGLETLKYQCWN